MSTKPTETFEISETEEVRFTEVTQPIMPEHISERVARMIESAYEKHGRGSWTRTEFWIKKNYGEWYDYLEAETP